MKNNLRIAPLDKSHITFLVKWLNQRPSRNLLRIRNMTNTSQQEAWVDSALKSFTDKYFIIINNGENIGFCGVEGIHWQARRCSVFIYLNKDFSDSVELQVGKELLNIAFLELGLNRVSIDVLAEKTTIIKTLEKIGFSKEVRKRQHYFNEKSYHHVIEMAILSSEFSNE